jgi:glycosyltransferase involved in cell wall biosynthesis
MVLSINLLQKINTTNIKGFFMKLIINANAHKSASLGSRRYFNGVHKYLKILHKDIQFSKKINFGLFDRFMELFQRRHKSEIFWSPCHRGPIWARNHVITVLDCINIEYTYKNDWRLPIYKFLFNRIYKNALKIIAISDATKNAILRNYDVDSKKIVVIAGPSYISMETDLSYEAGPINLEIKNPFALFITNKTYHKNTLNGCLGIINAKAFRDRRYSLVVVGSVDPSVLEQCKDHIDFYIFDKVSDSFLSYLYKNCAFLFSPSFDEGLNMPVAEGLSLGLNVLCSDIPVHREFYDGFVQFFDPNRVEDITEKIDKIIEHNVTSNVKEDKFVGINFESVASQYSKLFDKISTELQEG